MMKKIILIILGIITVFVVIAGIWIYWAIKNSFSQQEKNIVVEVIEDESTRQVADDLAKKSIIKHPLIFTYYSLLTNKQIMPGIYYLSPDMNMMQILAILNQGKISEKKITIPEGWRREQIAQKLADELIVEKKEFLQATEDLEGYLFPDTYYFSLEKSVDKVVKKLTDNFRDKTTGLDVSRERLILASIIEREAKHDEDRAKIAGVYQNRLNEGMKLEADPTIQYIKGDWEIINASDLQLASPYNTYIYEGLPPTPICNPGLKSIKAALNPAKHDYYYFFNLRDGTTIYSKIFEEHKANIEKYKDQM